MVAITMIGLPVGPMQVVAMSLFDLLTALGILVTARQKSMQGSQVVSLFVIMPLTLATFGTYGVDAVRQIALDSQLPSQYVLHAPGVDALVFVAFFVVFLVPGVPLFREPD
jgi:hypothetical protein